MTLLDHRHLRPALDFFAQASLSVCSSIYFIASLQLVWQPLFISYQSPILLALFGIGLPLHLLLLHQALSRCATSSSKDTRSADASTTSTASICAPHMVRKATIYKRGPSSSAMPAKNTQRTSLKLQTRGVDIQILGTEQPVTDHRIDTPPGTIADETCCLR